MTVEKVANYTAEQVALAKDKYTAGVTVEAIAEMLGKTVQSVRAKLAKEGVYKAKAKEAGKREMLKSEMVAEIAKLVEANEEVVESLEKATGAALKAVMTALQRKVAASG